MFKEFVLLCKKLELFSREVVAINGSKFKAVNSKKRNFNEPKLVKKLNEIDEKIEKYFKELVENDNDETSTSDCTDLKAKIEQLKKRKEDCQHGRNRYRAKCLDALLRLLFTQSDVSRVKEICEVNLGKA